MTEPIHSIYGDTQPDQIRDISVQNGFHDSVDISYKVQTDTLDLVQAGVYVDGELVGRLPSTSINTSAAALQPGSHSLEIIPINTGQPAPDRHGYAIGDRVYLEWPASESEYLSHYLIYRDATLIGTQKDLQVFQQDFQPTITGGRVTVSGYPSDRVNQSFTITVTGNTFTFDGEEYTFQTGSPVSLPHGVQIVFHDDPGEYTGFSVFVGVQNTFLTASQTPGTYTFSVKAVDIAGNESAVIEKTISVVQLPSPVTVNNTSVTGDTDVTKVYIFTDYNAVFDSHDTYINTDAPAQVLEPTGAITLGGLSVFDNVTLPVGSRFYAFPERDGVRTEDFRIYTLIDPGTPTAQLLIPGDLDLQPAPDGNMSIQFTYRFETGDEAVRFRVYYGTDPDSLSANTIILKAAGTGSQTKTYTLTLPAMYSTGTVVYAKARAETATVNGELSDMVSAVAVADDPTLTGPLSGVQS